VVKIGDNKIAANVAIQTARCPVPDSQAPNFAYEHCIRRISPEERATLNLATWKAAGNAAEPINPEVLEKFIETFEPCGFRRAASAPAYGLAEATLLVSSTRLNAGPRILQLDADAVFDERVTPVETGGVGRKVVSCGELVGDTKVAIVNPENLSKCRGDEIGEIWVSDPRSPPDIGISPPSLKRYLVHT
jgi:acyl-CoA synthetase (AMP-forming)/AMP-acid ligase II